MSQIDFQSSTHFHRQELACRCGCGAALIEPNLVTALEQLRDLVGAPVVITDAYRCPAHNKAVGGVPDSQHMLGRAADLVIPQLPTVVAMFSQAMEIVSFRAGGIGIYTGEDGTTPRLHCDVRLNGPARWGVRFGETEIPIEDAIVASGALQRKRKGNLPA